MPSDRSLKVGYDRTLVNLEGATNLIVFQKIPTFLTDTWGSFYLLPQREEGKKQLGLEMGKMGFTQK